MASFTIVTTIVDAFAVEVLLTVSEETLGSKRNLELLVSLWFFPIQTEKPNHWLRNHLRNQTAIFAGTPKSRDMCHKAKMTKKLWVRNSERNKMRLV